MTISRKEVFLEASSLIDEPGFEDLTDMELLRTAKVSIQARQRKEQEVQEQMIDNSMKKLEQLELDFKELK